MTILDLNNLTIEQNKLLNAINVELKIDYHELVQDLYAAVDDNIFCYVNSLLSRNNFQSNVFFNLCYLELVKNISKEDQISEVIVLNQVQKKILKGLFSKQKIKITLNTSRKNQIKYTLKPFYSFCLNSVFSFSSIISSSKKRRIKLIENKLEITLIDTFATPFEFESGCYKSRHYPKEELWDYLTQKEKKSVYFLPEIVGTLSIGSIIRKLQSSEENHIFKNDLLTICDYIKAVFAPLRIKRIDFDSFLFRGIKIGPLLRSDYLMNLSNGNSFKGILNFYFFKRARKIGLKFNLILNWFENQPLDKGFNFGARTFYPNTKTIGFQPFLQDLNFSFHLCPTNCEKDRRVIPQSIVVIGKKYKNLVKIFCKDLHVATGPSIRYKYLNSINYSQVRLKKEYILIALPISLKESRDIINLLADVLKNKKDFKDGKEWIIKPHPDLNLGILQEEFIDFWNNFKVVYQPINELLIKSSAVITNGSSVAFEAIVSGIPVCIIGAQNGFTQNPIPADIDRKIWNLCYTKNDLYQFLKMISLYKESDRNQLIVIGKQIKEGYFEPVNLTTVRALLHLA